MPELVSITAVRLSETKVVLYALDRDGVVWKLIDPDGVRTGWTHVGPEPATEEGLEGWHRNPHGGAGASQGTAESSLSP